MKERPALRLVESTQQPRVGAAPEAIAFARDLARRRARAMMEALINDSAPRT